MSVPLVVDSSILFELVVRTERSPLAEEAVQGQDLLAPDLIDLEVLSAIRRWEHRRAISSAKAQRAVGRVRHAPIERLPCGTLLETIWRHRRNLTPYDAAYVALAERLGCPLLTSDRALASAPHVGVDVRLI